MLEDNIHHTGKYHCTDRLQFDWLDYVFFLHTMILSLIKLVSMVIDCCKTSFSKCVIMVNFKTVNSITAQ